MTSFIAVPTKKHDGGSKPNHAVGIAVDDPEVNDAFAKYSNTLARMKQLLFLEDDSVEGGGEDDLSFLAPLNDALRHVGISARGHAQAAQAQNNIEDTSKRRKGNDSLPIQQQQQVVLERKTRLSWEVHPSLLFHDFWMYLDTDGAANISDDEEDEDDETETEVTEEE